MMTVVATTHVAIRLIRVTDKLVSISCDGELITFVVKETGALECKQPDFDRSIEKLAAGDEFDRCNDQHVAAFETIHERIMLFAEAGMLAARESIYPPAYL